MEIKNKVLFKLYSHERLFMKYHGLNVCTALYVIFIEFF